MTVNGNENIVTALLFITSMVVGDTSFMKTGFQKLIQLEFEMKRDFLK